MTGKESRRYTAADCTETGYGMSLSNKVIVIRAEDLPDDHPGQLFLCTGDFGAKAIPCKDYFSAKTVASEYTVFAVSLSNGEHCRLNRGDVIGLLKPELLPDDAKMQLSKIRPEGANDVENPEFSGYSFLPDGRYGAGVWLRDPREAVAYMMMQAPYQHRVLICDRDDFAVAEMVKGKLLFPSREKLEAYLEGGAGPEETGGMKMT